MPDSDKNNLNKGYEKQKRSLKTFNIIMGIAHLLVMLWILFFAGTYLVEIKVGDGSFDLSIKYLVVTYLALAGSHHLLMLHKGIYTSYYNKLLLRLNVIRWIEYSISSSVMVVLIAVLVGITSLASLFIIFYLNFICIFAGLFAEIDNQNREEKKIKHFLFGMIVALIIWLSIFSTLYQSVSHESEIFLITVTTLLTFGFFPLHSFLAWMQTGPWANYFLVEKIYIGLSFGAKFILAFQVFLLTI